MTTKQSGKKTCKFCDGTGKRGYTDGNTGKVHKNVYECSHCAEKSGKNVKSKSAFEVIKNMDEPMQMFDMVCMANYFAGQFNQNVPVDESRQVFKRIKTLLPRTVVKKRRKFCKDGKHHFLGMAGDICKNCDYVGYSTRTVKKEKR